MIFPILMVVAGVLLCENKTVEEAARSVLVSISQDNILCLRAIIINPELKFQGSQLNPSVIDSLKFRQPGYKSYRDLIKSGVRIDFTKSGITRTAYFVEKKYYSQYLKYKQRFKKRFFMKKYFACNFKQVNLQWNLTEDLCFTEGEY